jgi:hypothetical protein
MAQQVLPRLRRRCLIGSLTAPSWKSAKNGTTIRLAGKGPRLSCSVDCKKPTPPTGWCAGRARRRPARTREEQAPVPRGRLERCRAVQTVAESKTPTGARRAQRGTNGVLPATAAAPSRSRTPSLLGISPPLLTLVSEWHCPCSRPRCYGISKLWPLHVGGQWSGDASPVSLSVGRVSGSFDCQLEVVPVDVDLT